MFGPILRGVSRGLVSRGTGATVFLAALALWSYGAAAMAADAASTPGNSAPRGKVALKPGEKLLTRDQLRTCLTEEKQIAEQRKQNTRMQAEFDTEQRDIQQRDSALKQRRAALDPADSAAETALTDEEQTLDRRVADYNGRLPQFNEQIKSFEAQRLDWADRCANKAFDEKDLFAIKRGK